MAGLQRSSHRGTTHSGCRGLTVGGLESFQKPTSETPIVSGGSSNPYQMAHCRMESAWSWGMMPATKCLLGSMAVAIGITAQALRQPMPKPLEPALIEPCILAGSRPGDYVLDPFGGSGTTAGVANLHGRNSVLCELNPEYADLMPPRIASIAGPSPARVEELEFE